MRSKKLLFIFFTFLAMLIFSMFSNFVGADSVYYEAKTYSYSYQIYNITTTENVRDIASSEIYKYPIHFSDYSLLHYDIYGYHGIFSVEYSNNSNFIYQPDSYLKYENYSDNRKSINFMKHEGRDSNNGYYFSRMTENKFNNYIRNREKLLYFIDEDSSQTYWNALFLNQTNYNLNYFNISYFILYNKSDQPSVNYNSMYFQIKLPTAATYFIYYFQDGRCFENSHHYFDFTLDINDDWNLLLFNYEINITSNLYNLNVTSFSEDGMIKDNHYESNIQFHNTETSNTTVIYILTDYVDSCVWKYYMSPIDFSENKTKDWTWNNLINLKKRNFNSGLLKDEEKIIRLTHDYITAENGVYYVYKDLEETFNKTEIKMNILIQMNFNENLRSNSKYFMIQVFNNKLRPTEPVAEFYLQFRGKITYHNGTEGVELGGFHIYNDQILMNIQFSLSKLTNTYDVIINNYRNTTLFETLEFNDLKFFYNTSFPFFNNVCVRYELCGKNAIMDIYGLDIEYYKPSTYSMNRIFNFTDRKFRTLGLSNSYVFNLKKDSYGFNYELSEVRIEANYKTSNIRYNFFEINGVEYNSLDNDSVALGSISNDKLNIYAYFEFYEQVDFDLQFRIWCKYEVTETPVPAINTIVNTLATSIAPIFVVLVPSLLLTLKFKLSKLGFFIIALVMLVICGVFGLIPLSYFLFITITVVLILIMLMKSEGMGLRK